MENETTFIPRVPDQCVMAPALSQNFFLTAFFIMEAEARNLYAKLVIVLGIGLQFYTHWKQWLCHGVSLKREKFIKEKVLSRDA